MPALPIILPDDIDTMIEESGKPALPAGRYLAIITGAEAKVSENGKNSYGINWSLLVNNNPDSFEDGWDTEAGTTQVRYYTYIGKYQNGRLSDTDKGWANTKMMRILGVSGKVFNPEEAKFRQIGVILEHVPSFDDRTLMKENPGHVPDQLYLGVKTAIDYVIGTEHAPKLANLAEAYAEQHAETVAELDAVFGEGSGEALADNQPKTQSEAAAKKERKVKAKPEGEDTPKDEPKTEAW